MQSIKMLGMCISVLIVSGCATLSKEECMTGNWEAIGYSDGVAGRSGDRVSEHNKACAKVGVAPDFKAWNRGRTEGLKQYCTEDNAYRIGTRGRHLNSVCPSQISARLSRKNREGRQYYALTNQLDKEQSKLNKYKKEYDKLRKGDNLHFATEREARSYFVQLPRKMRDARERIDHLEDEISYHQRQYGY